MKTGNAPKITVILPTYNRRGFLPRALECICRQTFRDWRLIVVNDGGEDVSDLVSACQDARISYHNRPHLGKAAQLNFALSHVETDYVSYMDDDDEVFPEHLEKLYAAAVRVQADFVYSDTYETIADPQGRIVSRKAGNRLDASFATIRVFNSVNHKQVLHAKALSDDVGPYDEAMRILIDFDYIKRLLRVARRPFHLREVTGEHFLRTDPRTGLFQSISGLWAADPEEAGRSLLRFFEKDPESLAQLYRRANMDRLAVRRMKSADGKGLWSRLGNLWRKPGPEAVRIGRFWDALAPEVNWRDMTPNGGLTAFFTLADESVPAIAALNASGAAPDSCRRRICDGRDLPFAVGNPAFVQTAVPNGWRFAYPEGKADRWIVLTTANELPRDFAIEFDYTPHAVFREQLQFDFGMDSLGDRLRFLVRDNRRLCVNAVEAGRFRNDAKSVPLTFPLDRPTHVLIRSTAGVYEFWADGQNLVSAEYRGPAGRKRRYGALVFYESDAKKPMDFEISGLRVMVAT